MFIQYCTNRIMYEGCCRNKCLKHLEKKNSIRQNGECY